MHWHLQLAFLMSSPIGIPQWHPWAPPLTSPIDIAIEIIIYHCPLASMGNPIRYPMGIPIGIIHWHPHGYRHWLPLIGIPIGTLLISPLASPIDVPIDIPHWIPINIPIGNPIDIHIGIPHWHPHWHPHRTTCSPYLCPRYARPYIDWPAILPGSPYLYIRARFPLH